MQCLLRKQEKKYPKSSEDLKYLIFYVQYFLPIRTTKGIDVKNLKDECIKCAFSVYKILHLIPSSIAKSFL